MRRRRETVVAAALAAAVVGVGAAVLVATRDGEPSLAQLAPVDPGPIHVHALGLDPADGSLYIATHTGLYRLPAGARTAERVGERYQDTMGFTVAGPRRFLGSGHPDINEARERGLPPHLGLIESTDGGLTWQPVSLTGEADFHVLRVAGRRVYGYDASNDRLLASADAGRTWQEVPKPGPLLDLVADPADARHVVAAVLGEDGQGLFESATGGASWRRIAGVAGLLAWPEQGSLYLVTGAGQVLVRAPEGDLAPRGHVGGQPAALLAVKPHELYAALHDGTIVQSADHGSTWSVRYRP